MTITDPAIEVHDPIVDHRRRMNAAVDQMIEHRADLGLVLEYLAANIDALPRHSTPFVSTRAIEGGFTVGIPCVLAELDALALLFGRGSATIQRRTKDRLTYVERPFGTALLYVYAAMCPVHEPSDPDCTTSFGAPCAAETV